MQKREQKAFISELLASQADPFSGPDTLQSGERLAPLPELTAPDGEPYRLAFGASEPYRLLLVFNTRCPACVEAIPSWNRLTWSLGKGARSIAITSDPVEEVLEYSRRQELDFRALSLNGVDYKNTSQVRFVPHTILVDPAGIVLGVWSDPLGAEQEEHIVNLLTSALSAPEPGAPEPGAPEPGAPEPGAPEPVDVAPVGSAE